MSAVARRPGAPIAALMSVILLWVAARAALWETPLRPPESVPQAIEHFLADVAPDYDGDGPEVPASVVLGPGAGLALLAVAAHDPQRTAFTQPHVSMRGTDIRAMPSASGAESPPVTAPFAQRDGQLPPVFGFPPSATPARSTSRWSGDAWVFLRQGGEGARQGGAILPTYGASQAGAVLRYRLTDATAGSALYLRLTSALDNRDGREGAVGIAARPLRNVPVAAMAEARLHQFGGETELRPAVMLISEFSPVELGYAMRLESYFQAGYVDGRFATGFADGQMRVTREVSDTTRASLRAGAGAWGGVQRDANRVDIGPTAVVDMRLGRTSARLAVDYRFRAAGDAAPDSGPAVTLSTGF